MNVNVIDKTTINECNNTKSTGARQRRVKLAAVKTTLYNPYLAHGRQIARDNKLGKLSDEHSGTSLPAGVTELYVTNTFNYDPSATYIPKLEVMKLDRPWTQEEERARQVEYSKLEEAHFRTGALLPMPKGRVVQIPTVRHFHYLNYHVRYQKPEQRQEWRKYLSEGAGMKHLYGSIKCDTTS